MKFETLALFMLLLAGFTTAAPTFSIEKSCDSQEVNLFSLKDKKGGNIAEPGHFKYQVCGEEVSTAKIRDSCRTGESSVISLFQRNDSHASTFGEYRWDVCVDGFETSVNKTCETPIFSLHSKTDSHVAEPGHFKYQVCEEKETVDNISLEVSTDAETVYVDGEQTSGGKYNTLELSNPYISTESGLGIIGYGELSSMEYVEGSPDTLRAVQTRGSFLVSNTESYSEIEDEGSEINQRTFMDQVETNFAFSVPNVPLVRVTYDSPFDTKGFDDRLSGSLGLYVRRPYTNSSELEIGTR
ncbi:MAG: hypothetical protein H8Z69_05570 [Nanohaloarchaea archaeon]|nr:hypothetical protein [Candidatus Nanohaloarchaea archaeon]